MKQNAGNLFHGIWRNSPEIARRICVGGEPAQRRVARFKGFWKEVDALATTVKIPEQIAKLLRLKGPQGERRVLEMLATEGYRAGALSPEVVGELLGLQPDETMRFPKRRRCTPGILLEGYEDISVALKDFRRHLSGDRGRGRNEVSDDVGLARRESMGMPSRIRGVGPFVAGVRG